MLEVEPRNFCFWILMMLGDEWNHDVSHDGVAWNFLLLRDLFYFMLMP